MLNLSQKDFEFIQSTYEHFPISYGEDSSISWKIAGASLDSASDYVCVIGAFDGFHRGHQALIAQAKAMADEKNSSILIQLFTLSPTSLMKSY